MINAGITVSRRIVVIITIASTELSITNIPCPKSMTSILEIRAKVTEPRITPANDMILISYLLTTQFSTPLILFI